MTREEAKSWYDELTDEKRLDLLIEHHVLKQSLCAQVLAMPTGAPDWIQRSIREAMRLRECERHLRKVIHVGTELLEDAIHRTGHNNRECSNCVGTGLVAGSSCCCCQGTGTRKI